MFNMASLLSILDLKYSDRIIKRNNNLQHKKLLIKFNIDLSVILFYSMSLIGTQFRHLNMVVHNLLNIDQMTSGL